MTTSTRQPTAPAAAVARARVEIAAAQDRVWAAVGDDDLVQVVEELAALRAGITALEAAVVVELDVRQVPRRKLHWASTAAWLAHATGETAAQAARTLRHARQLLGDRDETHRRLGEGEVSPAQAAVVLDRVADLPSDPALRDRVEPALLGHARDLDATELARTARFAIETADPDGTARRTEADLAREDRAAHDGRHLSITDDGYGGVRVKGRASLEDGAVLRAALLPLTKPAPGTHPETGEPLDTDSRDHGARMWDALVGLAQHALDTDLPPDSHGTTPRVSVTLSLEDLHSGVRAHARSATTDDGLDLHPAVVRRMACDADVIPVVLGSDSQVLDVGRTRRLVTEAIWRALVTRDRHCAFPGCGRPPLMCHAHHVVHWADGGATCLDNLVLLCGYHHHVLHETPWRVRLDPVDRSPEFLPPPRHRSGPSDDPTWIRHRTRTHPKRE